MADNYLEYAREDYERRKAAWLAKRKPRSLIKRTSRPAPKSAPTSSAPSDGVPTTQGSANPNKQPQI